MVQPCSVSSGLALVSAWLLHGSELTPTSAFFSCICPPHYNMEFQGGLQLYPTLPFPQILSPLCTAVRPSLEPSLCVEMTQSVAHERATGPLMNITATILISLPLFGKTDIPCSIYSHTKEHFSQFKCSHFKSSKVSQERVSASD